jgi:hypothetical protein
MAANLSLHVNFRDQGFRWPLHDNYDVQVWSSDHQLVATLTGRLIRHLVELHLGGAVIQRELQALVRPPVKMPSRMLLARQHREILRKRRRSRRIQP